MKLPPRPARWAYICEEQAAMESQGVLIGSQTVVAPLTTCKLAPENVEAIMQSF